VVSTRAGDNATVIVVGFGPALEGSGQNVFDPYWYQPPVMERIQLNGTTPVTGTKEFIALTGVWVDSSSGDHSGVISIMDESNNVSFLLESNDEGAGWLIDEPAKIYPGQDDNTVRQSFDFESDTIGQYPSGDWEGLPWGIAVVADGVNQVLGIGGGAGRRITLNLSDPVASQTIRFRAYIPSGNRVAVSFRQTKDQDGEPFGPSWFDANGGMLVFNLDGTVLVYDGGFRALQPATTFTPDTWQTWEIEYSIFEGTFRRICRDGVLVGHYEDSLRIAPSSTVQPPLGTIDQISWQNFGPTLPDALLLDDICVGGCNAIVRIMALDPYRKGDPGDAAYLQPDSTSTLWLGPYAFETYADKRPTHPYGFYLGGISSQWLTLFRGLDLNIRAAGVKLDLWPEVMWDFIEQ
jgi:hypothetical protein